MAIGIRDGRSQRGPWPMDIRLGTEVYRTGEVGEGADMQIKPAPSATERVNPQTYGDASRDPLVESVAIWSDLSLGIGLPEQLDTPSKDKRANYYLNADGTTGEWLLGPQIESVLPSDVDATYGWEHAIEFEGELYFFGGGKMVKYVNDSSLTLVRDFGDVRITDVFIAAFAAATSPTNAPYLYICLGGDEGDPCMHRYDGVSWSIPTSTAVLPRAECGAVIGNRWYQCYGDNLLSHTPGTTAGIDPFAVVAASWTHVVVGDRSSKIKRIVGDSAGAVVILLEDAIFTMSSVSTADQVFPYITQSPDQHNGSVLGFFEDQIYVQYNEGFFRFDPDFIIEPVGLEKLTQNNSPIRGKVTAFAAHSTFFAYAGVRNEDGDSYLVKFGGWTPVAEVQQGESSTARHIDAWHGSITNVFGGDRITGLVKSAIGDDASEEEPRMYILFQSGYIRWFKLSATPNPAAPSSVNSYPFSTANGQVYLPRFYGTFKNEPKLFSAIQVNGRRLLNYEGGEGEASVDVYYRTNENFNWTLLGNVVLGGATDKLYFPTNTKGLWIELYADLQSTGTASPAVTSLSLYHAQWVEPRDTYEVLVLCADHLINRRNQPVRRLDRQTIKDNLTQLIRSNGTFEYEETDGTVHNVRVLDFRRTSAYDDLAADYKDAYLLKLLEVVEDSDYRTGQWSDIEALATWTAVEAKTHAQLEAL